MRNAWAGSEVQVREEPLTALHEVDRIPIRFRVSSVLQIEVIDDGIGGLRFTEQNLAIGYEKDYDEDSAGGPSRLLERFDTSQWGLLTAWIGADRVGAALVAWGSVDACLLENRHDLAVLWDLRVQPEWRGRGIGSSLFHAAEGWARMRGCSQLKVETQNINVPACRFYVRCGCVLGGINRYAYPSLPSEVQLLWYKDLMGEVARESHGVKHRNGV